MRTPFIIAAISILFLSSFILQDKKDPSLDYASKEGDILFQTLTGGELVSAINGVSESNYNHCGVLVKDSNNIWMVVEAYNRVVKTPLGAWIKRGEKEGFAVYRLKSFFNSSISSFVDSAKAMLGLPYDYHFDVDDEHIYCSELVYKAFERATGSLLGEMEALGKLNWKPFEKFIRKTENGGLPLDRMIITPQNLSMASQLECVFKEKI